VARDRRDEVVPGFTELEVLADGSDTTVYRARDVVSGQLVALESFGRPGAVTPEVAARADEVTRILATLSRHPEIVTLHRRVTATDGRPVLVLELCAGSLADQRAHGPVEPRRVVAMGVTLAGALETAHRAGIVHGAVGPEHVLVTRYGEVRLTGFAAGTTGTTPSEDPVAVAADLHDLTRTLAGLLDDTTTPPPLAELLAWALADVPAERPRTPLELLHHLHQVEAACGWELTTARIGGVDPLPGADVPTRRADRAAAVTGLPPLGLRKLDPGPGRRD
jgi:serine/threonine protein kinase